MCILTCFTCALAVAAPLNRNTRHNVASTIFFLIDLSPETKVDSSLTRPGFTFNG
jgi:hypothetical protein